MPRTRELKPAFFQDEDLATLSRDHRLLFEALWTLADREGRLEDRPAFIKINFCPYDDDMPASRVDKMLDDLAKHPKRFIVRYEADGQRCILVRNLKEHQHIHPKEAASILPPPDSSGEVPGSPGKVAESSNFSPLPSIPSLPSLPSEPVSDLAHARDPGTAEPVLPAHALVRSEPGKPSADMVLSTFSAIRGRTCATKALFYQASETAKTKCAALLSGMDRDAVADIEPVIQRACEHVRDGIEDWTDNRMRDPNFLWGTIAARWTALREELHGLSPPAHPTKADRKANEQRSVIENWRPRDERERQAK